MNIIAFKLYSFFWRFFLVMLYKKLLKFSYSKNFNKVLQVFAYFYYNFLDFSLF